MKRLLMPILAGLATITAYVTGVNQGYDQGSDTMQCVTYLTLFPERHDIVADACERAESYSTSGPAYQARLFWLKVTGDGVEVDGTMVRVYPEDDGNAK